MKTAAYIARLTAAGVDPKLAQAHGEAIEALLTDSHVTRDYLDSKLHELRASIYQAMFMQGLAVVGLTVSLVKLLP